VFDGFDVADSLLAGSSAVTAMRRLHQADDEWVVIVDLDEFVEFPGPIDALAGAAERAGTTVVRGMMYDRFSYDGRTVDFPPGADLAQVYPVKSRFIRNVMGGLDYKGILVRGRLRPASAHHRFEDERLYQMLLEISHYKWVGGSIERLRANYRLAADASMPWTGEYKRALDQHAWPVRLGRVRWSAGRGLRRRSLGRMHRLWCAGLRTRIRLFSGALRQGVVPRRPEEIRREPGRPGWLTRSRISRCSTTSASNTAICCPASAGSATTTLSVAV
jgi:hypothetical protein